MKLVISYDPKRFGDDPVIYSIPKSQATYRVDLYVKRADRERADRHIRDYPDRFRAREVFEAALKDLRSIAAGPIAVEDAYFEIWAG